MAGRGRHQPAWYRDTRVGMEVGGGKGGEEVLTLILGEASSEGARKRES